jgi:hypothetical protein
LQQDKEFTPGTITQQWHSRATEFEVAPIVDQAQFLRVLFT